MRFRGCILAIASVALSFAACTMAPLHSPSAGDFKRFGAVSSEGYSLLETGDAEGAVRAMNEAIALVPDSAMAYYNRACAASRAGSAAEALGFLNRAVELGWDDPEHMKTDPDLEEARKDARFAEIADRSLRNEGINREAVEDVWRTPFEGRPAGSFQEIEKRYEDALETARAGGSAYPYTLYRERLSRVEGRKAADLRAYIASSGDREDGREARAKLAEILLEADVPCVREERDRLVAEFLAKWPKDEKAGAMRVRLAEKAEEEDTMALRGAKPVEAAGGPGPAPSWLADWEAIAAEFPGTEPGGKALMHVGAYYQDRGEEGALRATEIWKTLLATYGEMKPVMREANFRLQKTIRRVEGIPAFDLVSTEGEPMSLPAARGKVLLLDFWGSWCGPCVAEIPNLKEVYASYRDQGFEIYGFAAEDKDEMPLESLRKWVAGRGMTWPQYYDPQGEEKSIAKAFRVNAFPTMILLDREGKLLEVDLRGEELGNAVEAALKAPAPPAQPTRSS